MPNRMEQWFADGDTPDEGQATRDAITMHRSATARTTEEDAIGVMTLDQLLRLRAERNYLDELAWGVTRTKLVRFPSIEVLHGFLYEEVVKRRHGRHPNGVGVALLARVSAGIWLAMQAADEMAAERRDVA